MSCPCHICLPLFDPACVLTMCINKSLHIDPYASCLVRPVTEYSATRGSSSFSDEHWPGMNIARLLLALEQGTRSLDDYILEYLSIANYSNLPGCLLLEFFCKGINQPLMSKFRREGPRSSLCQFMDYALLCVGSPFTVGVADEKRDTASMAEMVAAPERTHKMAATTTPRHVFASIHETSQVPVDLHELSQVTVDRHESRQVSADHHESSQGTADRHESSQVTSDRHESSHVSADSPESLHISADLPESLHVSSGLPEFLPVTAGHPESRHVTAGHPESRHITAGHPESHHVTADHPESRHVTTDHPEPCHVTADQPESRHILSATPRYSRSVLQYPCCCFFTITRWMSTVSMVQEHALFSDVDDPIEDLYHLIQEAGDSSFESLDEDDSPSTSTSSTKSSQVTFIYIVLLTIQIVSMQLHDIKIAK